MVEFGAKSESPSAGSFHVHMSLLRPHNVNAWNYAIPAGFICAVVLSTFETEKTQKGTQLNSLDMALFL